MKQVISIFFFLLFSLAVNSQQINKYWAFFTDKCNAEFDPYTYFDQKTIARRLKQNIPLNDYTDLPVCDRYINKVKSIAAETSHHSRWFNAIAFYGTDVQAQEILNLTFVDSIAVIYNNVKPVLAEEENEEILAPPLIERMLDAQTKILGGHHFEKNNITGKGVRVAIFDAGFPGVDKAKAFKHLRDSNRIITTFDFVKNKENVYSYSTHGASVLSCIGGIYEDIKVGLAIDAEFLLARTENATSEPYSEEENWLAAVEWADKHGADIINSSLAYTKHRYFNWEMDGKESLVARAANMAAKKGILVVNAAGNDGDNSWKYIGTPADADSVLAVGGVSPYTNYHIRFSSYGPTSDKRMKPNVCAYGEAVVAGNTGIRITQGTSFASPLIAGYAACVWQLHPEYTNMEVFSAIEKSASLYPYYDYAHGYGIPNARYFFEEKAKEIPTISFDETEKNVIIRIKDGEYQEGKKADYVFVHIENDKGYLDTYKVVKVESQSPTYIKKKKLKPGYTLRASYNGYVASYKM